MNMCYIWTRKLVVKHTQIQTHSKYFNFLELNHKGNMLWKGWWIFIVWTLWNHRNHIVFRNAVPYSMAQVRVWTW